MEKPLWDVSAGSVKSTGTAFTHSPSTIWATARTPRILPKRFYSAERIEAYIDGELTPVEQGLLEAHVAACSACAAELEDARRLVGALHTLPQATCPDAVSQALHDRIHQTRRTAAKRWCAPLAAAAVLVLIAGHLLFDPEPVPPAFSPKETDKYFKA